MAGPGLRDVSEGHGPGLWSVVWSMKVTALGRKGRPLWDVLAEGEWRPGSLGLALPWPEGSAEGPPALTSNRGRFSKTSEEGSTPKGRRVTHLKRGDSNSCDLHVPPVGIRVPSYSRSLEGRRREAQDGAAVGRTHWLHAGQRDPKPGRPRSLCSWLQEAWVLFG